MNEPIIITIDMIKAGTAVLQEHIFDEAMGGYDAEEVARLVYEAMRPLELPPT